ncbi:MAG: response regulator [Sphingobium sp.]
MPMHETVNFLLVDDVEENLTALEALLARDGLRLFKARSGSEALELLLLHEFALALVDVQMPGMDGFELAELMRGTERTRSIPIMFLTAVATDEGRRFRGYETGAVDYLFKPLDVRMLSSKVDVFFDLARQRQAVARQRDELHRTAATLEAALGRLNAHIDNSPLAIVEFDPNLQIVTWSKGAERMFGWEAQDVLGKYALDLRWIHLDESAEFVQHVTDLMAGDQPRNMHLHRLCRQDGTVIHCEWFLSALLDASGKPISVNAQILDVTERVRAEETQHLLIGELNHRVKNTLASVQAIAGQTLRHAEDPEEFANKFTGRIRSLAGAHSLLSGMTFKGASLTDLITDQLQLGTVDTSMFEASGPPVYLAPQMALHLALILHELATNANKYGSLRSPSGRITVTWTTDDGWLDLLWTESGGNAVTPPARRGFGTTLIERSVKADGGRAEVSYHDDGICWRLVLPLPETEEMVPARANAAPHGGPSHGQGEPDGIKGKCFLIIEDEPLIAFELASILEELGAERVETAESREEALNSLSRTTFDGALLDGNLHGKPVDDVAAELSRRSIPFLFVTGYGC